MVQHAPFVIPFSILLFIRACHGQQSAPIPSAPPAIGSGPRTVGNITYTILCDQLDQNSVAPYVTTHLPTDIQDFDACMALCNDFGPSCEVSLWDPTQANPCTLLAAVAPAQAPPVPTGRCYAAKFGGPLPGSLSLPVSLAPGTASFLSGSSIPTSIPLSLSPLSPQNVSLPVLSIFSSSEETTTSSTSTALESEETSTSTSSEPEETSTSSEETSTSTDAESATSTDISLSGPTGVLSSSQPERTNALCGPNWGEIPIPECPQTDPTWGRCCSRFGFCGNETAYCGLGCLTGFGSCDSSVQSSAILASSVGQPIVSSQPIASPLPFFPFSPLPSAPSPFAETVYWLPFLPTLSATPPIPVVASTPFPQIISHGVLFSSALGPVPFPSAKPAPSSIETPSPMLPNPPLVDLNSSITLQLGPSSMKTPSPMLPNPPVIDLSTTSTTSSGLAAVGIPSAYILSVDVLPEAANVASTDLASASLSAPTDSSISATLPQLTGEPLQLTLPTSLSGDVSSAVSSAASVLSTSSFITPVPYGPNPPVIDVSPSASATPLASSALSFVA